MRTSREIVEYYRSIKSSDLFGFIGMVLLPRLHFADAKEFLKPDADPGHWDEPEPADDESVLLEMRDYMLFAWEKAANHRGLSASRSVQKMQAWLWLLGDDELLAFAQKDENYKQYGAPILRSISEKYGFPIPDEDGLRRMSEGKPCRDGCNEGCGEGIIRFNRIDSSMMETLINE